MIGFFKKHIPKSPSLPDPDRTSYDRPFDPYEASARDALKMLSDDEHVFLRLQYGLGGSDPLPAAKIAERMNLPIFIILDIGTGAELRLRNNASIRRSMENLVALEMEGIIDLCSRLSRYEDWSRRDHDMRSWLLRRRPIRRMALSTYLEGGFRELLDIVSRGEAAQVSFKTALQHVQISETPNSRI